ncbi:hypothetical protein SUGI_0463450 [Cryptomeria japonica]|nr:hypothetical protein SUGI_0463450 [Cryptomeria japonica]
MKTRECVNFQKRHNVDNQFGVHLSSTMCTDKWRNLSKEYKKAKHSQDKRDQSAKMSCYKDLEGLLRERAKSTPYRTPAKMVVAPPRPLDNSYVHFSPKSMLFDSLLLYPFDR